MSEGTQKGTIGQTTIPGTQVVTEWVMIDPGIARDFLSANATNRNLRRVGVTRLARDMALGGYAITHQGIAFDTDGNLLDGQHRLEAIVSSQSPQWMLVTWGLPATSQHHVDRGIGRKVHDFMGGSHKVTRASAARIAAAVLELDGRINPRTLDAAMRVTTDTEVLAIAERAGDAIDRYARGATRAARNLSDGIGPSAMLAAAIFYPDAAEDMFTKIGDMSGMEEGDPALALLRYQGANVTTPAASVLALKTAKAITEGRSVRRVRTPGPGEEVIVDISRLVAE